jgi:hypothetical protein|eukprot:CAMPEP_0169107892 /NCGR_PEP_ID=MMETSP1015-20121227/25133_1 /TAXON_ID=342587 /ORGANISM="Karlodinium micrum, Strain CCMP2283" /LENGTH=40 /DNA_ID= /DNA_START= /DNA_END= /DNA_ORIENTATION=
MKDADSLLELAELGRELVSIVENEFALDLKPPQASFGGIL